MKHAPLVASNSGQTAVIEGVENKVIEVHGFLVSADAEVDVKFQSASTDLTGLLYLAAKGDIAVPVSDHCLFKTAPGEDLNINLSGAVAVGGYLIYTDYSEVY